MPFNVRAAIARINEAFAGMLEDLGGVCEGLTETNRRLDDFERPPGPAGSDGARGLTGAAGIPGECGVPGPEGSAGPRGLEGPQGASGAAGQSGLNGREGEPGAQGETGARGPAGPPGPKGDRGPAGLPGPKAARGPAGASVTGVRLRGNDLIIDIDGKPRNVGRVKAAAAFVPGGGGGGIDFGPGIDAPVNITENYTAARSELIIADASAGPIMVDISNAPLGRYWIKKTDSSNNKVTVNGGPDIDGDGFFELLGQHEAVTVMRAGAEWWIV